MSFQKEQMVMPQVLVQLKVIKKDYHCLEVVIRTLNHQAKAKYQLKNKAN